MRDNGHIIWSDDLDYDDWKDELEADYPELSEEKRMERMYDINGEYLCDERENLNIKLGEPILVIGDLGLWNGRRMGFKEIASGNISDCLYSDTEYATWYVDEYGDLRCEAIHHDGTNNYLYRVYRKSATEEERDDLKNKIYSGEVTRSDIDRVTSGIGKEIAEVYGFDISIPRESVMER